MTSTLRWLLGATARARARARGPWMPRWRFPASPGRDRPAPARRLSLSRRPRLAEPHTLEERKGTLKLLAHPVGGESSEPLPVWRPFKVGGLREATMAEGRSPRAPRRRAVARRATPFSLVPSL